MLELFHPLVGDWFRATFGDVTEPQARGWPAIRAGDDVLISAPTGSGKSLVALAAHFAALARGQRSFYTAPIKALVSEKFFALCAELGSDRVGMLTDSTGLHRDEPQQEPAIVQVRDRLCEQAERHQHGRHHRIR